MPPLYLLKNAGAPLWAPPGAVGVVTGANKGIGLEIAAGLAANGLPVVATARSEERGLAAVEAIRSRVPETKAQVSFLQLDVASDASVSEFAKKLRGVAPAGGKIDFLLVLLLAGLLFLSLSLSLSPYYSSLSLSLSLSLL